MQSSDLANRNDPALFGRLDRAGPGRVAIQGKMSPGFVIIAEVIGKNPIQMGLVEHDGVVEAVATDRSDDSLYEW